MTLSDYERSLRYLDSDDEFEIFLSDSDSDSD